MTQEQFFARYKYNPSSDLLGKGSFGKVYKAYDDVEDRYVAIKVSEVDPTNEAVTLLKEVELINKLPSNKFVAKYNQSYRFSTPHGMYDYGILQYYPDGNLSQLIRSKTLTDAQKESIALGIIEGLGYLHDNKIVHRDLKSGNILVAKGYEGDYIPKIADFGLSKQFKQNEGSYFSNSLVGGTLSYAAPEQLKSNVPIKKNVDIWSLGVILYELWQGVVPFKADRDTQDESSRQEIIQKINNATLPEGIHSIPEPWQTLIRKCIVVDNSQRLQDIAAVKAILGMQGGTRTDEGTILDEPTQKPKKQPKSTSKAPATSKPNYLPYIIGVLGIIIGVIGLRQCSGGGTSSELPQAEVADTTQSKDDIVVPHASPDPSPALSSKPYIKMISIPGRNFKLSETEVTIGQYLAFCRATNSHWPEWLEAGGIYNIYTGSNKWYSDIGMSESNENHPITGVSAIDADAFCRWMGGRLPTEAEWEYAAKGGKSYKYAGSDNIDAVAWYDGNSGGKAHRVRDKNPNDYGLYDMSGNVWEWTSSKKGFDRIGRSGCWSIYAEGCRFSYRNSFTPSWRSVYFGFRLAAGQ